MTRPGATPGKHAPGAKRTPFVLLLGGLVVGGLCALLALNTASAANEVQRHDLALRDQNIAARVVQLQNDQQASAAPANLARAAQALGMVPAGDPGFLEVGSDGRVRVVGKAAPATAAPLPVPNPTPKHSPAQHKQKQKQKKTDPKKSDPKKSDPKKSDPKKSDPKKSDPKKSDPKTKKSDDHNTGNQGTSNQKNDKKKTSPNKHGKHHTQSHDERRAGAPITTITIPGGPR